MQPFASTPNVLLQVARGDIYTLLKDMCNIPSLPSVGDVYDVSFLFCLNIVVLLDCQNRPMWLVPTPCDSPYDK